MRYLKMTLTFLTLFALMGLGSKEVKITEGILPGNLAPVFNLQGVELKESDYVLVQFWAATNPQSRLNNTQMHNVISKMEDKNVHLISICLDESEAVFKGVVKVDKLDESTQIYLPELKRNPALKNYDLIAESGNWLIDSQGMIVANHLDAKNVLDIVAK